MPWEAARRKKPWAVRLHRRPKAELKLVLLVRADAPRPFATHCLCDMLQREGRMLSGGQVADRKPRPPPGLLASGLCQGLLPLAYVVP